MTKLEYSKEAIEIHMKVKNLFKNILDYINGDSDLYSKIDKFVGGLDIGVYVFKTFNSKDVILKMFADAIGVRLQPIEIKKSTDIKGLIKEYCIKDTFVVLSVTRKGTKNAQLADLKEIAKERNITFIVITNHNLTIEAKVIIKQSSFFSIYSSHSLVLTNTKSGEKISIGYGKLII